MMHLNFDAEHHEYLDKRKMHTLDYKGKYFQVKGAAKCWSF
ncbi:oxidoreductase [Staphylococcus gallinarum]|uniref:Oxidoreductase n=1 Tax=Staphylococcus gallinarum TaxID=1293 RepID=A0A380FMY7_STAGA|nr:oxidoreductase [Staphylococcus gallinarum]